MQVLPLTGSPANLLSRTIVCQLISSACAAAPHLSSWTGACNSSPATQFHTSTTCRAESDSEASQVEQPVASSSSDSKGGAGAPAAAKPSSRGRARHISLDDPELNIYLRHNTGFVTDPDRSYAIGHGKAFERMTRQELLKALAAQRLYLNDAAAAVTAGPASSKQLPLREQMLARLSEIQDQVTSR